MGGAYFLVTAPYLSTVICERVYKILPAGQRPGKGSPGASLSHSMGRCVSTTWRIRGKEGLARGERKSENRKTPDSEFKGGVPNCAGMTSWNQFGQLLLQTNSQVRRPPPQNIFWNQFKVLHTQNRLA